jgi:DNA-binding CsgD family transcriptional regulator
MPVMGDWPLIGRGDEVRLLTGVLDAEATSGGMVIAGGAGVGKTRLAREAAAAAAERGWVIRSVQGTAAAQAIPLGAFAQWVGHLDDQPLTLVSSVIAALTASPDNAPVLVVVDDVHLIDDLSAFVLHQLVRRHEATVIATLRTGERVPETVTALWKDGQLQRLNLEPLSREQCILLLEAVLGDPIEDRSAARLWELTGGNVLFVRELVKQELQAGRLVRDDEDRWQWTGLSAVSPTLSELVDTYVGAASEQLLEVLDLVAVAEPLALEHLVALADPAAIEEAERRELISISHDAADDLVRLGQPLYGETRRNRMGRMRARRLCGRIAQAISKPGPDAVGADPVRLALLWLESDLPGDADMHDRGAAAAFRRFDLPLSARLAEAAARAGAGAATQSRILHARTLSMLGRGEEAEQLLAVWSDAEKPDAAWAEAKVLRALNLLLILGRPEQSWMVIEDALNEAPEPLNQALLAFRALQLSMGGRPAEVVALLDSIDPAQLTPDSRINLNYGTTLAFGELGRLEEATQTPEDSLVLATDALANPFQAAWLAVMHVDVLAMSGHITEALGFSRQMVQQWADLPDVPRTIAAAVEGVAALAHGDLIAARETLSAAMASHILHDETAALASRGIGYWLGIAYTEALARAGDVDAATRALGKMEQHRHPSLAFLEPNRMLAGAWVAAARGRATEAITLVGQAADVARAHGQHAREVLCLQTAIQFGDDGHSDRLAELAALVEGPRAGIAARWADVLKCHDGDGLLEVSGDLETMGDRIGAADAAAHAAIAFGRQNLRGSKLTASGRATRIAGECGSTTPATRDIAAPLPLSRREREIATLVRDGLSNKEIADTLTMSVRTVEGHILRACKKVDVANRAALGELINQFTQ